MTNLFSYSLPKLEDLMLFIGQKKYRATQIFKWIYEKRVTNFDEMSDVSLSFREFLKDNYTLDKPKIFKNRLKPLIRAFRGSSLLTYSVMLNLFQHLTRKQI